MESGDNLELGFAREREILTVSGLNREARLLIEGGLGTVWVEGEISNLARPSSGHMYWSLKDSQAQVRCAMFRQANRSLGFQPENGLQVLVRARASLYETRGEYQLIVDHMEEAGEGLLRRRFEALKQKLAAEGLFASERKKALPAIPARIGVVTSPTGAALRDVLIALRRRFPAAAVLIYPTSVQGDKAAGEIVRALELADRRADCDLLILTRGGGSLEDLWPFNEEVVARAVAALATPIIVGVGHEVDFTIADFAADLRAPTPSQAAELAVPMQAELRARLAGYAELLGRGARRRLRDEMRELATLAHRLGRMHPGVVLEAKQQRLDELEGRMLRAARLGLADARQNLIGLGKRLRRANPARQLPPARERLRRGTAMLESAMRRRLERVDGRVSLAARTLSALSPLATLDRGYAIVTRLDDGRILTDAAAVGPGAGIGVRLARGELEAEVVERRKPRTDN